MEIITGGVTAAKGFKAAAAAAEIKYKGRTDMAMVYSEVPCVAAGTFTTNVVNPFQEGSESWWCCPRLPWRARSGLHPTYPCIHKWIPP